MLLLPADEKTSTHGHRPYLECNERGSTIYAGIRMAD